MDEYFIIDEELDARRGGSLTGWESVVFEVEDEPDYDGVESES